MKKPTEVFKQTECGLYEVSNYSNIRTTPYKFFKGKKLVESKNEIISIADVSASKREAIINKKIVFISNPKFPIILDV